MANTYRWSTDGNGRLRTFINEQECPSPVEMCARFYAEKTAFPTDAKVPAGMTKAAVQTSVEAHSHPDVFNWIKTH